VKDTVWQVSTMHATSVLDGVDKRRCSAVSGVHDCRAQWADQLQKDLDFLPRTRGASRTVYSVHVISDRKKLPHRCLQH
jgi:hypothetical protein